MHTVPQQQFRISDQEEDTRLGRSVVFLSLSRSPTNHRVSQKYWIPSCELVLGQSSGKKIILAVIYPFQDAESGIKLLGSSACRVANLSQVKHAENKHLSGHPAMHAHSSVMKLLNAQENLSRTNAPKRNISADFTSIQRISCLGLLI